VAGEVLQIESGNSDLKIKGKKLSFFFFTPWPDWGPRLC